MNSISEPSGGRAPGYAACMDVSDGALNSLAVTLAERGATGVAMAVVGVVLVALLIGAFWLGKRRRDQELPPPRPEEQPVAPDHRSHIEEHDVHHTGGSPAAGTGGGHHTDSFPDDGRGLSPYELGEHGNQPLPPDSDERRD